MSKALKWSFITRVGVVAGALAAASSARATATYCVNQTVTTGATTYNNGIQVNEANGNAYSKSCVPPNLESVEATSFSIVFKVADADVNTPLVVALYTSSSQATGSPARFINYPFSAICTTYYDYTSANPVCYHKVTITDLSPGTQYYYNVNMGTNGTCNGASCSTCSSTANPSTCSISGGNWFDTRRPVKTAPAPAIGATTPIHLVVMGDSRNGTQGSCGSDEEGYWAPSDSVICGGSGAERNQYGQAIYNYHQANPINLIVHGGDLAESDGIRSTMTYWANMGSWWRDISTTVAFGNHEFSSPDYATQSSPAIPHTGVQEIFGTYADTNADDMLAAPVTPTSLGGIPYPAGQVTFYAQNYGNVHVVYLNTQLCGIDALDYDPNKPGSSPKCSDGTTAASAGNETQSNQPCNCWTYSKLQRDWLIGDLTAANNDKAIDWIIVSQHKAYWSNGPTGSGALGEWTNTLGKLEYNYTSDTDPNNLTQPSGPYQTNQFKPLDAIYQMYNVDLVLSSHAHYYELITDKRYRPSGDGLPHMLVGGSAAAEQLYQCPVNNSNCNVGPLNTSKSPLVPTHLPANVQFNYAADSQFFIGDLVATGTTMKRDAFPVNGGVVGGSLNGYSTMFSRKWQIRTNQSLHSSRFNGCNVPYPPSNLAGNSYNAQTGAGGNCNVQ